ncbi:GAP family protein [Cellulomonas fengjieae]|uniref:GAP family protein n=1 Tax=Cellulomonas fengjieae TaxID=2819978 RepID=A0ABS3SJM0_9CELL|nr:GAP family protein [Cellulomonas fengjieae]MBO3085953.1 GAP family protein [Cellulomonas fengjieae]QVI65975.1 GAP family protein [Cellulomonas fengjieae]
MDWSRVVAGAALIVLGVRKWVARPRRGEAVETPAWMALLEDASTGRALGLGLLLSGANPKNIVLIGSAMAAAIETGAHDGDLALAAAVFVVIGSSTVVGAVLAHTFGGAGAAAATALDQTRSRNARCAASSAAASSAIPG